MNLKISIFTTILISFIIIFLFNNNLDVIVKEFKINEENREVILTDLNNVEERYINGPFYTEEIVQEGIEIVSSNEEIIDNKKHIKIVLKSLESKIFYKKVYLSVSLFNEKKETIYTFNKEFDNMQPQQIEEVFFDISLYKASYFKIHYRTEGGEVIK